MKCSSCHKPTKETTNGLCGDCYIPYEDRPNYDYLADGNAGGHAINIPTTTCKHCGDSIYQPMPTGIWEHGEHWYLGDNEKPHLATPASTLFMLQQENTEWNRDSTYVKICYLHQKYWNVQLKEKGEYIERCGRLNDWSRTLWFRERSERPNIMGFRAFVLDKTRNFLKRIPRPPKLYLVFKVRHGRGYNSRTERIDEKLIQTFKEVPPDNETLKIKKRRYTVLSSSSMYQINAFRNEIILELKKK